MPSTATHTSQQKDSTTDTRAVMRDALLELRRLRKKIKTMAAERNEPVAVIGMACRFPGADTIASYWDLLAGGRHAISEVPRDRWPLDQFYDPNPEAKGKVYSRFGGYIGPLDGFDAQFFGISHREAACMDPQQRLALEVTWEALENANINPQSIYGSNTGVFLGIGNWENAVIRFGLAEPDTIGPYEGTGSCGCVAAGRIAYVLGLTGPNMAIDTACSSSLLSAHLACESLRRKECDMALTGGTHLLLLPGMSICFSRAGMLSPDGRSKAFDAAANGYVRSEGCGMVLLKRLSDAEKDGDHIWAILRGSAVNQDGGSGGLTVPSGPSQEAVIKSALANAGLDPDDISYIEAHGTGTPLGDPIEMRAIGNVFCRNGRPYPLTVGSVKTNIGHLESSAGVSALIKTVLMLHHRQITPHLHFNEPSPHIEWDRLNVEIPKHLKEWVLPPGRRLLAGISSFGFSGTNVHAVLEAYPHSADSRDINPSTSPNGQIENTDEGPYILILSALQPPALDELVHRYIDYLTADKGDHTAEICFSALTGRADHPSRLAAIGQTNGELAERLNDFLQKNAHPLMLSNVLPDGSPASASDEPPPAISDRDLVLRQAAEAYVQQGLRFQWSDLYHGPLPLKRRLPLYPFQHQSFPVNPFGLRLPSFKSEALPADRHPLLGRRLCTPLKQIIYESHLEQNEPAYLKDHRVYGATILPAAGFIEMILRAGRDIAQDGVLRISAMDIRSPLVLNSSATVQVILKQQAAADYRFKIHSTAAADTPSEDWSLHAEGAFSHNEMDKKTSPSRLSQFKEACQTDLDVETFYNRLTTSGFAYGPRFRVLDRIHAGPEMICGHVRQNDPAESPDTPSAHIFHPSLLDGGLQLITHLMPKGHEKRLFLPVGLDRFELYTNPAGSFWICAQPAAQNKTGEFKADLMFLGDNGDVVATIKGLTGRPVSRQTLTRHFKTGLSHLLYQTAWHPIQWDARTPSKSNRTDASACLVLAGHESPDRETLIRHLTASGRRPICATPGAAYAQIAEDHFQLNPLDPQSYRDLFEHLTTLQQSLGHIIYLPGALDVLTGDIPVPISAEPAFPLVPMLTTLFKTLKVSGIHPAPQLTFLTRGAVCVAREKLPAPPFQAVIWGAGKSLRKEYPQFNICLLDLDPAEDESAAGVCQVLSGKTGEPEMARRQGRFWAPRLVPCPPVPDAASNPFALRLQGGYGLDRLARMPADRLPPREHEVEIKVHTAGLNFRDVLHALGMLATATEAMGFDKVSDIPMGFECSGVVTAKGEGVRHLEIGDPVVAALAKGSLASFVTVPADFVVGKPANTGFREAATLTTAFLTAYYGLRHLAGLKKGERVLIHAASGGVGMAAVSIARMTGAVVYATASPAKWPFLKHLGIHCLMNSRDLDFSAQILAQTDNQGVDVVLNSLTGDFIPKSLAALGQGGRFIEIGKIGIWSNAEMQAARNDVAYFPFDLNEVAQQNPILIRELLNEMQRAVGRERFTPLPLHGFGIDDVTAAFEYMAQARHIGKVVVSLDDSAGLTASQPFKTRGTVLITGGTGALGLLLAEHLAQEGTAHILLVSRREPEGAVKRRIEAFKTPVNVVQADVADQAQLQKVFAALSNGLPPLKGILHCAGILDDGLLATLDADRFRRVLAPKVSGTWHLHRLSLACDLDFFVMFSSIASILGNAGQSSYAAANAFLDQMAPYRRSLGLPGVTINWGAWQKGMAAVNNRLEHQGARGLDTDTAMALLLQIIRQNPANVCAMDIDWPQYLQQVHPEEIPPLLAHFKDRGRRTKAEQSQVSAILKQLSQAPAGEETALFKTYLGHLAAVVLGSGTQFLIDDRPLMEQGFDSLMAVELRNRVSRDIRNSLPASLLFDYPTLDKITRFILDEILQLSHNKPDFGNEASPDPLPSAVYSADEVLEEIETLLD